MEPAGVIDPIEPLPMSVNHTFPSGPEVMAFGLCSDAAVKLVTTPAVVMRPIAPLPALELVNHRFPSAPLVMAPGPTILGSVNVETLPVVVIRPMDGELPPLVNHRAPSAPAVMPEARRSQPR